MRVKQTLFTIEYYEHELFEEGELGVHKMVSDCISVFKSEENEKKYIIIRPTGIETVWCDSLVGIYPTENLQLELDMEV